MLTAEGQLTVYSQTPCKTTGLGVFELQIPGHVVQRDERGKATNGKAGV